MGNFSAPVETAFNVSEVMMYARVLGYDLADSESDDEELWNIVHFWELLGNSLWVPRLMGIQQQQRLDKLVAATPLHLYRNQLLPRDESVSAVTPGVVNELRSRVRAAVMDVSERTNGQYSSLGNEELWSELEGEAAVDFVFRSVKPNFELRGCAMCGKWYEPQLSNRGRFCSGDCRKRFNNMKHSKKEEKNFECAWDGAKVGMENFSGLVDKRDDDVVSPLRIGAYNSRSNSNWCLDCVERERKEWARYIAPLLEARVERERDIKNVQIERELAEYAGD